LKRRRNRRGSPRHTFGRNIVALAQVIADQRAGAGQHGGDQGTTVHAVKERPVEPPKVPPRGSASIYSTPGLGVLHIFTVQERVSKFLFPLEIQIGLSFDSSPLPRAISLNGGLVISQADDDGLRRIGESAAAVRRRQTLIGSRSGFYTDCNYFDILCIIAREVDLSQERKSPYAKEKFALISYK